MHHCGQLKNASFPASCVQNLDINSHSSVQILLVSSTEALCGKVCWTKTTHNVQVALAYTFLFTCIMTAAVALINHAHQFKL